MMKRTIIGGVVIIAGLIAGFIFLIRGCLSAYDERSAQPPVLYFEKDGRSVVFAIIKYEKATSYKSGNGMVSKTVSTNYYIQCNDAATGQKIDAKKIKHHSDVKNFPVSVMGKSNGNAWVFIGEPMAFNPFTLERTADKSMIEAKNPALKGKMPEQAAYYKYNAATGELMITATDGLKYALSTADLSATPLEDEDIAATPLQVKIKQLAKKYEEYEKLNQFYYGEFRRYNKLYSSRQVGQSTYLDSTKYFNRQNDLIRKLRDSLRDDQRDLEAMERAGQDRQRNMENLKSTTVSFSTMCVDADTMNGRWYGLRTAADLEKFYHHFDYRNSYTETARNKLYTASISIKDPSGMAVELEVGDPEKLHDAVYLQGGFLLDKETALPIHLKNEDGFIICYKEKVGYGGNIMLARIDLNGNVKWTINTHTNLFNDWVFTGRSLIILSADNKKLSSGDANVLSIVDLQNGQVTAYDYFTDKLRGK